MTNVKTELLFGLSLKHSFQTTQSTRRLVLLFALWKPAPSDGMTLEE